MNVSPRLLSLLLLLALLGCTAALPAYADVYTVAVAAADAPAVYSGTPALKGLYDACVSTTDANAPPDQRQVAIVLTPGMSDTIVAAIATGQYYIGGYYDATTDTWIWDGDAGKGVSVDFATGPTAERINDIVASSWAAGYPQMQPGTSTIGTLKYMAYDASLKGWVNVDGTETLSGVMCQGNTVVSDVAAKSKFPWWAILILVLGIVVVIAVVLTVVLCCCCRKKKRYTDDDDESAFTSRSGSFSTRGTSRSGSSHTGSSASSSAFSSRGSSKSSGATGTSSGSSASGSTGTDGTSRSGTMSRSSSFSSRASSSHSETSRRTDRSG